MNHLCTQDLFNNSSSLDTNQIIFWSYFVISHQFESISMVLIMVHKWEHILIIILNNDTSIRTYLDDSVHGATLIRTQFGVSCRAQQSKTPWWFMKVTHVRAHLDVCWRPQQLNTPWWFFMVTHQPKHLTDDSSQRHINQNTVMICYGGALFIHYFWRWCIPLLSV